MKPNKKNISQPAHEASSASWLNAIGAPVALLLILLATLVPFFLHTQAWAVVAFPFVYSVGAAALIVVRLFSPYRGTDMRLRRWHRMESWSAIIFGVAAFFLFYNPGNLRDWLAFTMAAAVIQIITSLAIPMREAKLAKKNLQ